MRANAAWQGYGPNPLWQSQLDRDGWGGWISRSVVALQMGQTQSLSQQVCVYKRDGAGRITKATQVEAGNGTWASPANTMFIPRMAGCASTFPWGSRRATGSTSTALTADCVWLSATTASPARALPPMAAIWAGWRKPLHHLPDDLPALGQRRELPPDSQTGAGARRGPGKEKTLSTRYLLR
ncbi:hypothetical protein O0544_00110 [Edwardsiella anguillarum]|nr:hypothetical protein [Edwardsiella anguillarum]